MKSIFDTYCYNASKHVTKTYSTSFYSGVSKLDKKIRNDVHAIYGMVRFADEIVDSFHDFDKETLLQEFKEATFLAIERKVSLNPILNSFQATVNKYSIDYDLINQFFNSMEMDLNPVKYTQEKYDEYIFGSAEAVGLMCLKIFVYGDSEEYEKLKPYAMRLGAAFQKINFLRDIKDDSQVLGRIYFPNVDTNNMTLENKLAIEVEIKKDFDEAYKGIGMLPKSSRFGVYMSYRYYSSLLKHIEKQTLNDLLNERFSIPNNLKRLLYAKSLIRHSINRL